MENVTFVKYTNAMTQEVSEFAVIDHGNDQFTSMLKSTYEAQQAEQSTPSVTDEAKTK
jgi:hypothetical protein